MSPEQAAGRLDLLGPASDVYSLGATLYAVLTGKPPVEGNDIAAVLTKVQRGHFSRPRQVKPDVNAALEAICLKAMALKPGDRYAAPRGLADDLERWLGDEPVLAYREPMAVRARRWARRHKPLVSGVAAACMVGAIALTIGVFWYHDQKAEVARKKATADAETSAKQTLVEVKIRQAIEQSRKTHEELHKMLKKPEGVFELLNQPERWDSQIQTARAALDRANVLLASADIGDKSNIRHDIRATATMLNQDVADYKMAMRLEQIYMDQSHWVVGRFDYVRAGPPFPKAFAEAKLSVAREDALETAARIRSSAIREQLISALDIWAWTAFFGKDFEQQALLLDLARLASPDPTWGDKLRRPKLWKDAHLLTELVKNAPNSVSRRTASLVSDLLGYAKLDQEAWLRSAQSRFPGDFWLNFQLGNAIRHQKPVEAEGFYRVALTIRPHNKAAYNNLGMALMNQSRTVEAIITYRKSLDLDPDQSVVWNNLSFALRSQNSFTAAIAASQKAIELDPMNPESHLNRGAVLRDQKQLSEATKAFQKASDLNQKDPRIHFELGSVLSMQNRFADAAACFQRAIDLDSKSPVLYRNLSSALHGQGRKDQAAAALLKAIELEGKESKKGK